MGALGDAYAHMSRINEGERIRREEERYQAFAKDAPPEGVEGWASCPGCGGALLLECISTVRTLYPIGQDGRYSLDLGQMVESGDRPGGPKPTRLSCRSCRKNFAMELFEHLEVQHERNYGDMIGRYVRPGPR